jgi:predicted histidine transporter YuiF (NhaC family)
MFRGGSLPAIDRRRRRRRPARSIVAVLIYLVGFVILLVMVSHYYLVPAIEATRDATHLQRKALSAYATLVLMLVLFVLLIGLLLTFKIGRFFRPRPLQPRKPTRYVDAWEESGRRLKLPEKDE